MRIQSLSLAALCAVTGTVSAQDEKKQLPAAAAAHTMPDPKTKAHEALKAFAGYWDSHVKMSAMPGVPGMEKEQEMTGSERAELLCNGLYLKSVTNGSFGGQPFQGIWILGYDPFKKTYTSLWADSQESGTWPGTGSLDEKTNTWTFEQQTPHGTMRSVVTFQGTDSASETCYSKGPDGKENVMMQITRKRAKAGTATDAAATTGKPNDVLAKSVGEWDAVMKMQEGPGGPWKEEKGTERVVAVCNGKWLWADFHSKMMGAPFEGHCLTTYDPATKKMTSYWIDSMSATSMMQQGEFDAAKKSGTMEGNCLCPEGKPMTCKAIETWTDDNTRHLKMDFKGADFTSSLELAYKRKK